jgi:hypothetical protein
MQRFTFLHLQDKPAKILYRQSRLLSNYVVVEECRLESDQ